MGGPCHGRHKESAHLANTYTALCILIMCGDDLKGIDIYSLNKSVAKFQNKKTGGMMML
jgi:prenyltransferase beta subunit